MNKTQLELVLLNQKLLSEDQAWDMIRKAWNLKPCKIKEQGVTFTVEITVVDKISKEYEYKLIIS